MGRNSKQITVTGQKESETFRYACLHRSKRIVFHMFATPDEVTAFDENDDIIHWWKINMDYHIDRYEFIQTAWFAGADQEQLKTIAFSYWGLNDLDCMAYIQNNRGITAERDGRKWKVYDDRKEYDPNSAEGNGGMLLLALIDYRINASRMENKRAYASN